MQNPTKTLNSFSRLVGIATFLLPFWRGGVTTFADEKFDQISHLTSTAEMDTWEIKCPNVKKKTADYRKR